MQLIKKARTERLIKHAWQFRAIHIPSTFLVFDCRADGSLLPFPSEAVQERYRECLQHPDQYESNGIAVWIWQQHHPAVIRCPCGGEVELSAFAACSQCGLDSQSAASGAGYTEGYIICPCT
jgi:hypothetical protein